MQIIIAFLILLGLQTVASSQVDTSYRQMNSREAELYQLMMSYRQKKKLDSIDISPSLCKVAQCHVRDLNMNDPKGRCNLHSWSNNGPWTACCYTDDHRKASCIWNKPRELTSYQGDGYEIAYWCSDSTFTPDEALDSWKASSGHHPLIINTGIWKSYQWKAIGIAIEGNYAVVWFGKEADLK